MSRFHRTASIAISAAILAPGNKWGYLTQSMIANLKIGVNRRW